MPLAAQVDGWNIDLLSAPAKSNTWRFWIVHETLLISAQHSEQLRFNAERWVFNMTISHITSLSQLNGILSKSKDKLTVRPVYSSSIVTAVQLLGVTRSLISTQHGKSPLLNWAGKRSNLNCRKVWSMSCDCAYLRGIIEAVHQRQLPEMWCRCRQWSGEGLLCLCDVRGSLKLQTMGSKCIFLIGQLSYSWKALPKLTNSKGPIKGAMPKL